LAFIAFGIVVIAGLQFFPWQGDPSAIRQSVQSLSSRKENPEPDKGSPVSSVIEPGETVDRAGGRSPKPGPKPVMAGVFSKPSGEANTDREANAPTVEQIMTEIYAAAKAKDWPLAAQRADLLVERRGNLSDRRLLGFLLINAGKYKRGIVELERLLEAGKADAELYHRLGHAYSTQRFHEKAFESFSAAIRLEPNNPRHYKCGATLIVKAYERGSDRFRARLSLAKNWCAKARELGMTAQELASLERDIERQ